MMQVSRGVHTGSDAHWDNMKDVLQRGRCALRSCSHTASLLCFCRPCSGVWARVPNGTFSTGPGGYDRGEGSAHVDPGHLVELVRIPMTRSSQ